VGESSKTTLEANGILGRICVEFEKVCGHYSHMIWLLIDNERIPVFKSVEDPVQANLPCFTELHQQGKNLFLTGANGPCHWSMSVEVGEARLRISEGLPASEAFLFAERFGLNAPHSNTSDPSFHFVFFDIACRVKDDVAMLGTAYSKSESVEYLSDCQANSGQIWQIIGHDKAKITFGANPERELLRFDPDPKCFLELEQDNILRISSAESADKKYPATVQWSYGIWV
jgi:hypothetical protein